MANPANVKPYAELVHISAQNGGPKKFLSIMAQKSYQMGIMHERRTEGIIVAISSLIISGLVWLNMETTKDKKRLETIVNETEKAMNEKEDKKRIKGEPVRYYQVDSQM